MLRAPLFQYFKKNKEAAAKSYDFAAAPSICFFSRDLRSQDRQDTINQSFAPFS